MPGIPSAKKEFFAPLQGLRGIAVLYVLLSHLGNAGLFLLPVPHDAIGKGRRTQVALDKINPQMAARMASAFNRWVRYDDGRKALMKQALQQIAAVPGLSADVSEIVNSALK